MLYDPEDDDCADAFELERFVVLREKDIIGGRNCFLQYIEFDRRLMQHTLHKNERMTEHKVILNLARYDSDNLSFYLRKYTVCYDCEERKRALYNVILI